MKRYPFGYDVSRHDDMSPRDAAVDIISRLSNRRLVNPDDKEKIIESYSVIIREKRHDSLMRSRAAHPANAGGTDK